MSIKAGKVCVNLNRTGINVQDYPSCNSMVFVRPITDISAAHGCSRIATSVCVVSSCTYFESKAFFQIYKQVKDICADHGGRWLAGTEGSHSARGMDVCVSFVFCVLSGRGRTDRSSRGFLPSVVCLSMISKPQQ